MSFSLGKRIVAEALGTFGFFFFAFSGVALSVLQPAQIGPIGVAVGFGLGLALMIFLCGHISGGHFNPAVTIALVCGRKASIREVPAYFLGQFIGGVTAVVLLRTIYGGTVTNNFVNTPGTGISHHIALILEIVVTTLFVMVISAVATDNAPWSGVLAPVAIGGFIATSLYIVGPASGGSFNPMRSLAPALVSGHWTNLWIYLVGPFIGAIIGGFGYSFLRDRS